MDETKELSKENLEAVTGGKQQPSEPGSLAFTCRPDIDSGASPLANDLLSSVTGGAGAERESAGLKTPEAMIKIAKKTP